MFADSFGLSECVVTFWVEEKDRAQFIERLQRIVQAEFHPERIDTGGGQDRALLPR